MQTLGNALIVAEQEQFEGVIISFLLQMEHYWQECLRLPLRIQEWDAYKEMRDAIKHYLDVFPILHKLNSKVPYGLVIFFLNEVGANSCNLKIATDWLNI